MGVNFTWAGIPAAKKAKIQNSLTSLVQKKDPKPEDVTENFVTNLLKKYLRSKAFHFLNDKINQEFSENYEDPI